MLYLLPFRCGRRGTVPLVSGLVRHVYRYLTPLSCQSFEWSKVNPASSTTKQSKPILEPTTLSNRFNILTLKQHSIIKTQAELKFVNGMVPMRWKGGDLLFYVLCWISVFRE